MKTYKFDWLNGGLEITPDKIYWTFAGFDIEGNGELTVNVCLEVKGAKFRVPLSTEGQATNRSDEAINKLMNELLKPYEVK